jgi:DHA2 family multidrug resistance protein
VEHLTPFDRAFQLTLPQISQILKNRGFASLPDQGSLGVIQAELLRQASMLSFNDTFHILSIMMVTILPLVLFMKVGKSGAPGQGIH